MNILSKVGVGLANEGQELEITGINGESLIEDETQKPFFTVVGKDSDIFRDAQYQIQSEIIKERAIDKEYKDTPALSRERRIRLVSACIIAWKNIADEDNQSIECNAENIAYILESSPHILDLVDEFLSKRENFQKKQ